MKTKCYHQFSLFILLLLVPLVCSGQAERIPLDSDLTDMGAGAWLTGEDLYFTLSSRPQGGHVNSVENQLWHTHLPSNQTVRVAFSENERLGYVVTDGRHLYAFTSQTPGITRLYRIGSGIIQSSIPVSSLAFTEPWAAVDGGIFYVAAHGNQNYRLWRSDATQSGTVEVVNEMGCNGVVARAGNRIFFCDGAGRLTFTDGTPGAPPVLGAPLPGLPSNFAAMGQSLIFQVGLYSVWHSDGTAAGTFELLGGKSITSIAANSEAALIGISTLSNPSRREVWAIRRNAPNPIRLLSWIDGHWPVAFSIGERLFFAGNDAELGHYQLWETNGVVEGTFPVVPLEQAHRITSLRVVASVEGQWLLLRGENTGGVPVAFTFDGEEAYPLAHWPGSASAALGEMGWETDQIQHARSLGGYLYCPMMYGHIGTELWQIAPDGSSRLVADVNPGVRWSFPRPLILHQGFLYFIAKEAGRGSALYRIRPEDFAGQVPLPPGSKGWTQSVMPVLQYVDAGYLQSGLANTGDVLATKGGDVYISGQRANATALAFPGNDLPARPKVYAGSVHYLARLDGADGKVRWAREIAADFSPILYNDALLAPAPDEGVYVANVFDKTIWLSDPPLEVNSRSAYIARFDSSGQVLWSLTGNLGQYGAMHSILRGRDNNLYAFGQFSFFQGSIGGVTFTGNTSPALFVAVISPSGQILKLRTFDAPTHWTFLLGNHIPVRQGPDGRFYMVLNQAGYHAEQACGLQPLRMLLRCIGEDLQAIAWERELVANDMAYVTAFDISPDNRLYLAGRYRGIFSHAGAAISKPCPDLGPFLAVFNLTGGLVQLIDYLEGDLIVHDLQFEPSGAYLIAGTERKPGTNNSFQGHYEGYMDRYFPNGRLSSFVQRRQARSHHLLQERRFLKPTLDGFGRHLPRLAQTPGGDLIFYDRTDRGGIMDTLPGVPYLRHQTQAVAVRFELPDDSEPGGENTDELLFFQLGPNPTDSHVTLFLSPGINDAMLQMELYNAFGQGLQVFRTGSAATPTIDLSELPAGMYFLRIAAGSRRGIAKIIKQ